MNAEKSIVNHWLNSKGYFTINNLNASGNKNIGILGLKFDNELLEEVIHAEVYCSITHFSNEDSSLKKILKRFIDTAISKAINSIVGKEKSNYNLRKILVAGKLPYSGKSALKKDFIEKGIEILEFEDVLLEVMLSLDTPYYKDDVLRALQLIKFILLAEPKRLAGLLSDKGNILNVNTRGIFLNELLKQELIKKELTKADETQIIDILKHTSLRKPDNLANAIEQDILSKRGMNKLISKLLKTTTQEKQEPEEEHGVKQLGEFF